VSSQRSDVDGDCRGRTRGRLRGELFQWRAHSRPEQFWRIVVATVDSSVTLRSRTRIRASPAGELEIGMTPSGDGVVPTQNGATAPHYAGGTASSGSLSSRHSTSGALHRSADARTTNREREDEESERLFVA
jgi:hypothetical protein